MGDVWSEAKGGRCWNFTKHFNDWEMEDAERLLLWLCEKKMYVEVNDTI